MAQTGAAREPNLQRRRGALAAVGAVARPVAVARERTLPVLPVLADLLPDGGLRRGSAVSIPIDAGSPNALGRERGGRQGSGGRSLASALVAGASEAGSWVAVVGMPAFGCGAAAGLGVALDRLVLVPDAESGATGEARSSRSWASVVAALIDGFDVVMVAPPPRPSGTEVRRLVATARERGTVLVVLGGSHNTELFGPELRLTVTASGWEGLGEGHGHLQARWVEVVADGRGAASRARRTTLWLPGPDGRVRVCTERQVLERAGRVALEPAAAAIVARDHVLADVG